MQTLLKMTLTLSLLFVGAFAGASEGNMHLQDFELMKCSEKQKCIRIEAESAESGNYVPLLALRNVKIEIILKGVIPGKGRLYKGKMAHYSLSDETIVLNREDGVEHFINLKDFNEKIY